MGTATDKLLGLTKVYVAPHVRYSYERPADLPQADTPDMEDSQDRLLTKFAAGAVRIYIPPYVRVQDGETIHVSGYFREVRSSQDLNDEEIKSFYGLDMDDERPDRAFHFETEGVAGTTRKVYEDAPIRQHRGYGLMGEEIVSPSRAVKGPSELLHRQRHNERRGVVPGASGGFLERLKAHIQSTDATDPRTRMVRYAQGDEMGSKTDALMVKLGRIYIPPFVRTVGGKPQKVDGHWREVKFDIGGNPKGLSSDERRAYESAKGGDYSLEADSKMVKDAAPALRKAGFRLDQGGVFRASVYNEGLREMVKQRSLEVSARPSEGKWRVSVRAQKGTLGVTEKTSFNVFESADEVIDFYNELVKKNKLKKEAAAKPRQGEREVDI